MDKQARMTGMRLGFTYAAVVVLIGFVVAMIAVPGDAAPRKAATTGSTRPPHALFSFTTAGDKPRRTTPGRPVNPAVATAKLAVPRR